MPQMKLKLPRSIVSLVAGCKYLLGTNFGKLAGGQCLPYATNHLTTQNSNENYYLSPKNQIKR
jgi:hypothetical protein